MKSRVVLGSILIVIGLFGIVTLGAFYSTLSYGNCNWGMGPWMMGPGAGYQYGQTVPLTMDQATSIAKHCLDSLNNPDLSLTSMPTWTSDTLCRANEAQFLNRDLMIEQNQMQNQRTAYSTQIPRM